MEFEIKKLGVTGTYTVRSPRKSEYLTLELLEKAKKEIAKSMDANSYLGFDAMGNYKNLTATEIMQRCKGMSLVNYPRHHGKSAWMEESAKINDKEWYNLRGNYLDSIINPPIKEENSMKQNTSMIDVNIQSVPNGFVVWRGQPSPHVADTPLGVFETVQGLNTFLKKILVPQPVKKTKKKRK